MNKFVLFIIIFSLPIIFSCKDNKHKINVNDKNIDNIDLINTYSSNTIQTEDDTNNNFSSIVLEGISNPILFKEEGDELEFNYRNSLIKLIYFNKKYSPDFTFFFKGGIYSKYGILEYIEFLIEYDTFQNNINNVHFFNFFILSAQEYSDLRFERDLLINTKEYIIIISIKNYNLINKIINENKQYFKLYDGNNYVPYNNDDVNDNTWPCWDHVNNATEKFLEDITNKKAGEFANLWFQETEDIVNSIKLE